MDVDTAYLNATLEEEIYLEPPTASDKAYSYLNRALSSSTSNQFVPPRFFDTARVSFPEIFH